MSRAKPVKGQYYVFGNLSSAKTSNSFAGSCPQLLLCAQRCSEILAHQMQLAATTKHVSKIKLDISFPCLNLHSILAGSQAVLSKVFRSSQVTKEPTYLVIFSGK